MSQENVEAARRGFELWNVVASDPDDATWSAAMEEMTAAYHPDAKLDFSRTAPDFAPTRGREAMTAWAAGARGTLVDVRFQPMDFIDVDDGVVVPVRVSGRGALSGVDIGGEFAYVFRYLAGQVISATTFPTLDEALEAVGLAE